MKIWAYSAGSLLQLPSHLIDGQWWHHARVCELSKSAAQPDRSASKVALFTFDAALLTECPWQLRRTGLQVLPAYSSHSHLQEQHEILCGHAQESLGSQFIVYVGPCSCDVVLKFGQDIKSNANRAQLDR